MQKGQLLSTSKKKKSLLLAAVWRKRVLYKIWGSRHNFSGNRREQIDPSQPFSVRTCKSVWQIVVCDVLMRKIKSAFAELTDSVSVINYIYASSYKEKLVKGYVCSCKYILHVFLCWVRAFRFSYPALLCLCLLCLIIMNPLGVPLQTFHLFCFVVFFFHNLF